MEYGICGTPVEYLCGVYGIPMEYMLGSAGRRSTRDAPKRLCEPKRAWTFDEARETFDEFGIISADHILGNVITGNHPTTVEYAS